MDIFGGLRKLLGIQEERPQLPQNAQPRQRVTEDSIPVNTARGQMPLSSVEPGQAWSNPETGYSPTGDNFQLPNYGAVYGAVNPVWQQQQGMGISNPMGISRRNGGPTPEPLPQSFSEILKRLR